MAKKNTRSLTGILVLLGFLGVASTAPAADTQYEITVTNLMHGEQVPPFPCNTGEQMGLFLFAIHKAGVKLFELGEPASPQLAILAESGRPFLLAGRLASEGAEVVTVPASQENLGATFPDAVLCPGQSLTATVDAPHGFRHISMAAMVFPTNDGFIALNGVSGPRGNQVLEFFSPAYDAGSEVNDENCANIPGLPDVRDVAPGDFYPGCPPGDLNTDNTVPDPNPAGGEGYVHIHSGIRGVEGGNLEPAQFDWRNPAARITIRRVLSGEDND
jgi:hypothetical protein